MLSVVMPLYNEGGHIFANLHETVAELRRLGEPFEVVAANDGSEDSSGLEIDRAAAELPEVRALHLPHAGKGEALRQGTRAARGDFVIFLDADLDLPPEQIQLFVTLQRVHEADVVVGSKHHPDSNLNYPLVRRIYSLGYYALVKVLFGLPVRDTQTGLKLMRRELLLQALDGTKIKGFAFDLELLVRLVQHGAKMVEAPVVVKHTIKFGGVGWRAIGGIFRDTWTVWRRTRGG